MPYVGKKPADIIATAVDTTTGTFSGDLTVDTSTLYVDSANNRVGVGTTSLTNVLHVHQTDATSNSYVHITQADGGSGGTDGLSIGIEDGGVNAVIRNRENGYLRIYTNNTERMRIDSSGNLLVGTTTADILDTSPSDTTGLVINSNGRLDIASTGVVQYLNMSGSDGTITEFRKNGSPVGSIGAESSRLFIAGEGVSGFRFGTVSSVPRIQPCNASGTATDGVSDLGYSSTRFKDLYLSGGIQFDSRSNKLDDYEEGTYEPTFTGSSAGTLTLQTTYRTLAYTKIGRQVTITGRIRNAASGTISGTLQISLPFAVANLTQEADIFSGSVLVRDLDVPTNTFDLNVLGEGGTSIINVYASIDNGVWHDIDGNDSPQNAYYIFGFSYFTT